MTEFRKTWKDPELSFFLPDTCMSWYQECGLSEGSLIEWCKQFCNKDSTILDIGAHTGTYSIKLADYCKNVYAFEPQTMTYYALCGSIAINDKENITPFKVGLGSPEQVGTQMLKIVSLDGGGSSLHATNYFKSEEIEVKTLDSFNLSNINFIKMDVEENELFVLKGGLETLKRCKYPKIVFEANDFEKSSELFEYIKAIGYTITNINGYKNMYLAYT